MLDISITLARQLSKVDYQKTMGAAKSKVQAFFRTVKKTEGYQKLKSTFDSLMCCFKRKPIRERTASDSDAALPMLQDKPREDFKETTVQMISRMLDTLRGSKGSTAAEEKLRSQKCIAVRGLQINQGIYEQAGTIAEDIFKCTTTEAIRARLDHSDVPQNFRERILERFETGV